MLQKSLTTKTTLTAISNALQFGIRLIMGLLVTPIIIRGLGKELYGIWVMIQQTLGYMALADLRVTSVVKYTLGADQYNTDVHYKRQQVGATVLAYGRVAPLILGLGLLVVWLIPQIISISPEYVISVRWAIAIGVVGIILDGLSSFPGNILRGENLEYKAMGLNAFISGLSSFLSAVVVWLNMGLVGLSLVTEGVTLLQGGVRYFVVRANVSWLGIERPSREMLRMFWRRTVWSFLAALGYVIQNSSDLLLIGVLLGPSTAAVYGATGLVLRMAIEPLYAIIGAASASIAGLCGVREWKRVERVRNEIHLMALCATVVLGVGVLMLNQDFVEFWLGSEYYGGAMLNFLLVIIALQNIPLRSDVMLLDGLLKFRERAISTIVTSLLGIGLGVVLARNYGVEGVAVGLIVGRLLAMAFYQRLIKQGSGIGSGAYFRWLSRPLLASAGLLIAGFQLPLAPAGIFGFLIAGTGVAVLTAAMLWWLGLNRQQRQALSQRFGSQLPIVAKYATRREE